MEKGEFLRGEILPFRCAAVNMASLGNAVQIQSLNRALHKESGHRPAAVLFRAVLEYASASQLPLQRFLLMPSDALKAIARTHAARIVSGEVTPAAGARAIWTDVFYHLELGDHCVDGFVYWADAVDDAEDEERRQFCESAIVRLAREFLANN